MARATETAEPKEEKATTEAAEPKEEMVKIKLFKDKEKYRDDLTVILNGKAYRIKRGIPVEVPKGVAEIIENSMTQDDKAAQLIEQLEADYNDNEFTKE